MGFGQNYQTLNDGDDYRKGRAERWRKLPWHQRLFRRVLWGLVGVGVIFVGGYLLAAVQGVLH